MPECRNCGSFVTEDYVRVFAPRGHESVRVCPECEDKVRRGGEVEDARAPRRAGNGERGRSKFDPELAADGGEPDE